MSCGVDYARLAEGDADYVLYYGVGGNRKKRGLPWDHAPGSLLLAEAGGALAAFDGQPYDAMRLSPDGLVGAGDGAVGELVRGLLPLF